MKKFLLLIVTAFGMALTVAGQSTYDSHFFTIEKGGTVNVSSITTEWQTILQMIEMPEPYGKAEALELARAKKEIGERYPQRAGQATNIKEQGTGPYLLNNFEGNIVSNSTPNDNYLAVSNGNKLITVINTNIYIYDLTTNSLLSNVALSTFFAPLAIAGQRSDPRVLYDPLADRFILMCFVNSTPVASKLTVAFSASNDPMGMWNLYWLSGNPLNDTTWSDYPAIAITQGELFITINQVIPNQPWQTGFSRTNIWQIDKNSGYNGDSVLTTRLWSNVKHNGTFVRYMCPVNGGSQPYGPNLYLLSNRNFAVQNDTIFLLEVTGLLSDSNTVVQVQPVITNVPYSVPPDARQGGGQTFATNDARMLGAFYENGKIQFVHNALDTSSGSASIYHGVIDNITTSPAVTGYVFGGGSPCFGYPNIAYAGKSSSDDRAIISVNYSDSNIFSGCTAFLYDGAGNYSINTNIKSGLNYVNVLTSPSERWGDYSGCQRKFNEPGKVWSSNSYGRTNKSHGTWIAELSVDAPTFVESPNTSMLNGIVYPNPLKDIVSVKFDNPKDEQLRFEIYNEKGKLVNLMFDNQVRKGENVFSFSTSPLSQGIYFLKISSKSETIFSQKIVKGL